MNRLKFLLLNVYLVIQIIYYTYKYEGMKDLLIMYNEEYNELERLEILNDLIKLLLDVKK